MSVNDCFMEGSHPSVSSFDPSEGYPKRRKKYQSSKKVSNQKPVKPAFSKLIQLISVRERSSKEILVRLMREGYTCEQSSQAIERAVECGLVDNCRFAESFIRTKVAAGKGKRSIEIELLNKHDIDIETVSGWPEEFGLDSESQTDAAFNLLLQHPPRSKDLWGSAYRKLIHKGYTSQVANQAVRLWFNDQNS